MDKCFKLNLQLFGGEGASGAGTGEGGGEGASTGVNATADAAQRLRELGVPEDKIRRRASKVATKAPAQTAPTAQAGTTAEAGQAEATNVESATTQTKPTTEETQDATKRMTWDEIMKDPEYNRQMQAVVRSRVKAEKSAEEALNKMAPAIEVLARKHGLDPKNMDYEALAQKINDDDAYYEDKALEMGVSVETAKKVDQKERDDERQRAIKQRNLQEQKIQNHFISLEQQAERMKKVFPSFDLRTELQNPVFARMTSPNIGISVDDAYYAIHRNEIQTASMQAAVRRTTENISNAIQSGSRRPNESGASSQAPSVTTFDYSKASKAQREAFKNDLRARMARGEKVYPGQR